MASEGPQKDIVGKRSYKDLKNPGLKALRGNQEALTKLQSEMTVLRERAGNNENVDGEILRLEKLRDKLIEEQKLIHPAGNIM